MKKRAELPNNLQLVLAVLEKKGASDECLYDS
jgi:hypothetical protein